MLPNVDELSDAALARLHVSDLAADLADHLIRRVVTVGAIGDYQETPETMLASVQSLAEQIPKLMAAATTAAVAAAMTWEEIGQVLPQPPARLGAAVAHRWRCDPDAHHDARALDDIVRRATGLDEQVSGGLPGWGKRL